MCSTSHKVGHFFSPLNSLFTSRVFCGLESEIYGRGFFPGARAAAWRAGPENLFRFSFRVYGKRVDVSGRGERGGQTQLAFILSNLMFINPGGSAGRTPLPPVTLPPTARHCSCCGLLTIPRMRKESGNRKKEESVIKSGWR